MRETRTEMVPVRMTAKDRAAIEQAAERAGMNVSEFLRAAALTVMVAELDPHALKALAAGMVDAVQRVGRVRQVQKA